MAVGVHGIAGPEDGGEGAADFGLVENGLDFGNARQDVVSRVPFLFEDFVGLPVDFFMELRREIDLNRCESIGDEFLHFPVVEEIYRIRHSLILREVGEEGRAGVILAFCAATLKK